MILAGSTILPLSDYYGIKGKQKRATYFDKLNKARREILDNYLDRAGGTNAASRKDDIEKLQDLLNSTWYSKDTEDKQIQEKYFDFLIKAFEKVTKKQIQGSVNSLQDFDTSFMEKAGTFSHKKSIEVDTLKRRIKNAQVTMNNLEKKATELGGKDVSYFGKTIKEWWDMADNLIKKSQNVLLRFVPDGENPQTLQQIFDLVDVKTIKFNTQELRNKIGEIDRMAWILSTAGITQQDLGTVGELMSGLVNLAENELTEENCDKLVADLLKGDGGFGFLTGKKLIGKGEVGYKNSHIGRIVDDENLNATKKRDSKNTWTLSFGEGNSQVKFDYNDKTTQNAGMTGKQIKMDVAFDTRKFSSGLRASVKNYSAFNNSIAASNLLHILQRFVAATNSNALSLPLRIYPDLLSDIYAVGQGEKGSISANWEQNRLERIHNYAKTAILLDTITGYAQKSGFVNILIINKRNKNGGNITVVDLVDEFKKMRQGSNIGKGKFQISGYDEIEIQKNLKNLYYSLLNSNENRISTALSRNSQRYLSSIRPKVILKFSGQL